MKTPCPLKTVFLDILQAHLLCSPNTYKMNWTQSTPPPYKIDTQLTELKSHGQCETETRKLNLKQFNRQLKTKYPTITISPRKLPHVTFSPTLSSSGTTSRDLLTNTSSSGTTSRDLQELPHVTFSPTQALQELPHVTFSPTQALQELPHVTFRNYLT